MADETTNGGAAPKPAAPKKKAKGKPVTVRALRAHTQPDTQVYRAEGDEFVHHGELYRHVEEVKGKPVEEEEEE